MKKLLLVLPALVTAAGFQILEQNVTYLGQAYAGTAASVENATATFYNPAGITQSKGWQFSFSTNMLLPQTSYTLTNAQPYYMSSGTWVTSGSTNLAGTNEYEAKHNIIPVPQLFLTKDYNDKLSFGLSINSPFGLKTEYPNDSNNPVRFWAVRSSLTTANIALTSAYKVTHELSLGLGPDYSIGALYLSKVSRSTGTLIDNQLFGNSWGWHAGVFYKSADFDAGFRFNSSIKYNLSGHVYPESLASTVTTTVTAPAVYVMSLNYHFNKNNNFLIDVQGTNWKSVQDIELTYSSGQLTALLASIHALSATAGGNPSIIPMNYKQASRCALGYQYLFSANSILRLGLGFDGTPSNDVDRSPAIPDQNRTMYSVGYTQKWGQSTLDLGYAFVKMGKAIINLQDPTTGAIAGTWNNHVHIFGIQWNAEWN